MITRQADYAVRAVMNLSRRGTGVRVPTAQIAKEESIPTTFLAKIISRLADSAVLHVTRGARGGVALARPAGEISLLEVIETIDGPLMLNECVADPSHCIQSDTCSVADVWQAAQVDLASRLGRTKFGDLVIASGQKSPPNGQEVSSDPELSLLRTRS